MAERLALEKSDAVFRAVQTTTVDSGLAAALYWYLQMRRGLCQSSGWKLLKLCPAVVLSPSSTDEKDSTFVALFVALFVEVVEILAAVVRTVVETCCRSAFHTCPSFAGCRNHIVEAVQNTRRNPRR